MDLSPFLDSLHRDLSASLAAAGPETARGGEQLLTALEPATRLMLLEVLSEAAAEITTALDGAAVDIRLRGRDADIVVTPAAPDEPEARPETRPETPDPGDGDTARITLRIPEQLKAQAEQAAAAEGASVNSWLVRAVSAALRPSSPGGFSPPYSGRGRRITGFAQG